MKLRRNIEETREEKIAKMANKKIAKIESKKRRKLENGEVAKVFEIAEKKIKKKEARRNKIIAILGALGIAIGGYAMLNSGNTSDEVAEETNVNDLNTDKKTNVFKEELAVNIDDNIQENLIDEILEKYNSKISDKIEKDELGIIYQVNMGEGNVLGEVLENGEVKYRENVLAAIHGDIKENEYWVLTDVIDGIYVLVDNNSNNTIAGIGSIGDSAEQYNEVVAETVYTNIGGSRNEYTINPDTYVYLETLDNEMDKKGMFAQFAEYYTERTSMMSQKKDNSIYK